ncbi:MAG: class I SAM-dependent methyltransferase [Candidatus Kariarchaeaceae archaeon]
MERWQPTKRFSDRVDNYVKYRPSYPQQIIPYLVKTIWLQPDMVVVDIGSGTGKLTELFLNNGYTVIGVEPNADMRKAGEIYLKSFPQFQSVDGTAEHTTLADNSADLVTAGQAFHWFDTLPTKREFHRILKPEGWVMLIWNSRLREGTPFLDAFETLLETYGIDYKEVSQMHVVDEKLEMFFAEKTYHKTAFQHFQSFDFTGLMGRLLSSSYAPSQSHPNYQPMMAELKKIYDLFQEKGRIQFDYTTDVYCFQLEA